MRLGLGLFLGASSGPTAPALPVEFLEETYFADASGTWPALPATQTVGGIAIGGGQGSTQNVGSGAGAPCAVASWVITGGDAWAVTVGAPGAVGLGNGGDTTITSAGVTKALGPGGNSATAAVGDTVNAGVAGALGTGNRNGGGSGGSEAAGALTVGGAPEGGKANLGVAGAATPGAGASSQTAVQGVGGNGMAVRKFYSEIAAGIPYIVHARHGRDTATLLTRNMTAPLGSGGILVAIPGVDTNPTVTMGAGWNAIYAQASSGTAATIAGYYIADTGSVAMNIDTSLSRAIDWWILRIANTTQAPLGVTKTGDSTNPTFNALDMGSSASTIWIASCVWDVTAASMGGLIDWPSGYVSRGYQPAISSGGVKQAICWKRSTAQTETPGQFTDSFSEQWCTSLIGIR